LVIGPRRTTVSDSRCLGVSPAHELRCAGLAKRGDIADLRDEDRRQRRANAGHLLHRPETGVVGQGCSQRSGDRGDLEVDGVDQPQQRIDPQPVGGIQRRGVQPLPAVDAEQIRHLRVQALLGQHAVHGGFQPAAPGDQLGAVPHHFSQLAHLRWGDPAFRQPIHAQ
jgi:hypothetical protein